MDDNGATTAPSSSLMTTLWRTDLYAPLAAWKAGDLTHNNNRKSQKVTALTDFVVEAAKEIRRNGKASSRKFNNVLKHDDVIGQMKEKQLSLIGGGIVSRKSNNPSKKRRKTGSGPGLEPFSNSKRKKMKMNVMAVGCITERHSTWEALENINRWWEQYALSLLKHANVTFQMLQAAARVGGKSTTTETVSRVFSNAELVGAFVTVDSCASQCHLAGAEGIIVRESLDVWTLATPLTTRKAGENCSDKALYKVRIVPKGARTTISARIRVPNDKTVFITLTR